MADKKPPKPEKINYDKPFEFIRIIVDTENLPNKVITNRQAIRWEDIASIEEYPAEYEDVIDWKQHKGKDKCYINTYNDCPGGGIVLMSYDEIMEYWKFYLEVVEICPTKMPFDMRKGQQPPKTN